MVQLKSRDDIERMRAVCGLASDTLEYLKQNAVAGVTTLELDGLAEAFIAEHGALASPKGYRGFPNSICTAVNDVVVHGIPTDQPLADGDLITIDVTVFRDGFHGDKAASLIVGAHDNGRAERLMLASEQAMYLGLAQARPDARLGDIGAAVQMHAEAQGYSVVRDFCGHGIGRSFHEDPQVLHFGVRGTGRRLQVGTVFTVEPMINEGSFEVRLLDDGWTVMTADGRLSAQFEHTVAVTEDSPDILTLHTDHEREMWSAQSPPTTS